MTAFTVSEAGAASWARAGAAHIVIAAAMAVLSIFILTSRTIAGPHSSAWRQGTQAGRRAGPPEAAAPAPRLQPQRMAISMSPISGLWMMKVSPDFLPTGYSVH